MKEKKKYDYGIKDIYNYYKNNYPNTLKYKEFAVILKEFNKLLIEEMYKGAYISLPYSLGDLYIYKYKPTLKFDEDGNIVTKGKYSMVDYKATNELWKEYPELKHKQRVIYDNFHSDGFKLRISWKRYHTVRTNKLYNFTPSRYFKRGLNKYFKVNPNQDYYDK